MDNTLTNIDHLKQTLVIIPCFNEEGRIGKTIQEVKRIFPALNVTVIDDSSTDHTAQEAIHAGATVLSHASNLGYGAALETGYNYALQNNYTSVFQMDGDGQHIAEELEKIMTPVLLDQADIVIGSRYSLDGSPVITIPALRRIGHRMFSFLVKLCCGIWINDPTSGFQAINRKALKFLTENGFPCDYPDSDVIIMSARSGLRILEIPVAMKERTGGKSMHSGLKPIYYAVKMLLSVFIVLLNFHRWQCIKCNKQ